MSDNKATIDQIIDTLKERSKELYCLYQVEELLHDYDRDIKDVLQWVVNFIPAGWQYPDLCQARIVYDDNEFTTPDFQPTPWKIDTPISLQDEVLGELEVSYKKQVPQEDVGSFFKEELKLIKAIAERISNFIMHQHLKEMKEELKLARSGRALQDENEARIVTEYLYRTDIDLFIRVARQMLNFLCRKGVSEAEQILQELSSDKLINSSSKLLGANRPTKPKGRANIIKLSRLTFEIAAKVLNESDFIERVRSWIHEDKISFLIKTLGDLHSTVKELTDDFLRFHQLQIRENIKISPYTLRSILVQAIQRLLTDQPGYVNVAKEYINVTDLSDLFQRLIYPVDSHGLLGGKGSGLFLAYRILKKHGSEQKKLENIRIPKTWYLTSDGLIRFLYHNDLQDIVNQKYKDIDQIKQEYAQIIEIMKNAKFMPEMVQRLTEALDDFGEVPLIVRSSSLLEDRLGSAFSGKYESLFLGNQGSRKERLAALLDAIAEVYASTFSPDAIEYRAERDLLDSQEQMGVLIQEVVGQRVGPYFLPAYGGVAFSNNDFRWSPRIRREDGLIRMSPGLGTRSVDRLSDDYPVLISPGQPGLKVNVSTDEIRRYSPNKIDLINLKHNAFETIDFRKFVRNYRDAFSPLKNIISVLHGDHLRPPSLLDDDGDDTEAVVTFDGLIKNTTFVKDVRQMLTLLQTALGFPVDIEFASDGTNFYLLQCRSQSFGRNIMPAEIPKQIPDDMLIFSANRYISNGTVNDISHIVYVDPLEYSKITDRDTMLQIGHAIGALNLELAKRKFILMGPGRWGSRGDIKLGVSVTYADINNTAVLIEIARKKGNYIPDLSFGTHFFQDLVEAEIYYLPLYPDAADVAFNEVFLDRSPNSLGQLLPRFSSLENVIRVINVPQVTGGSILRILMNGDEDEAVAILVKPVGDLD